MKKQHGITIVHILLVVVLVAGVFIGFKMYTAHQEAMEKEALAARLAAEKAQLHKSYDALSGIVRQWDDAVTLAESTARIGLAQRIADLQQIKRDTDAIATQKCLAISSEKLKESMTYTIDALMQFMSKGNDDSGYITPMLAGRSTRTEFNKEFSICKDSIEKM